MSGFGWYRPWLADLFDSEATSKAKAVAAALAIAERGGVVRKPTSELAAAASLDPKTVRAALAELEDAGWLHRRRSRDYVEVQLRPRPEPPADSQNGHHARSSTGTTPDRNGHHARTRRGTTPDTSTSPTSLPENARDGEHEERDLAEQLLKRFNSIAGTSYPAYTATGRQSAPLRRIAEALAELDELTLEVGERMIRHALGAPWWGSQLAKPGHVFGPGVRDDNFQAAASRGRRGIDSAIDRMNAKFEQRQARAAG